jgi:hypothetical protein
MKEMQTAEMQTDDEDDFAKYPYVLWYVHDVNIPKDAEDSHKNQRSRAFGTSWGRWWFICTNREARKSVAAGRFIFINVASKSKKK